MRITPEEYANWQREAGLVKVIVLPDEEPDDLGCDLEPDPADRYADWGS